MLTINEKGWPGAFLQYLYYSHKYVMKSSLFFNYIKLWNQYLFLSYMSGRMNHISWLGDISTKLNILNK